MIGVRKDTEMKKSHFVASFWLTALVLLCPAAFAQSATSTTSTTTQQRQEQALRDLVNEVQQLRLAIQQLTVRNSRAQIALERMKMHQEQVTQVSRELAATREMISATRARQANVKAAIDEAQKQVDAGVKSPETVNALVREHEAMRQREDDLTARETRLGVELEVERARTAELNQRLEEIEREMVNPRSNVQPAKR